MDFKLKRRLIYTTKKFYNSIQFAFLPLSGKYILSKYKDKAISIRNSTNSSILKENITEVFKNGKLSICNYKFNTISNTPLHISSRKEFELLGGVHEIFIKDPYNTKKYIQNRKGLIIPNYEAYIGLFFLSVSSLSNTSKIYIFEPTTETSNLMKDIFLENKINNVFTFNVALGDDLKNLTLLTFIEGLRSGSILLETGRIYPRNVINQEVKIITIDYFVFQQEKLNKIDYIKIDTEGFEKKILKRAKETIKKFKLIIACVAYHFHYSKEKIIDTILNIKNYYQYYLN